MTEVILHTSGRGLWTKAKKAVRITNIDMGYVSDDEEYGELQVFFDTATWNINKDGLIYTDTKFLRELQAFLKAQGLAGSNVDYSEQGMQGRNYVSLDFGKRFLQSWNKKFR